MNNIQNTETDNSEYNLEHILTPIAKRWLNWQCSMIAGVKVAAIYMRSVSDDNSPHRLGVWPANASHSHLEKLNIVSGYELQASKNAVNKFHCTTEEGTDICDSINLPIQHVNKVVGSVSLILTTREESQQMAVLQLLQWGVIWLESALDHEQDKYYQHHPLIIDLIKMSIRNVPLEVVGNEICNTIAQYFNCERVALGITKGLQTHTLALSNQLRFDSRSTSVRDIEALMEETVDQQHAITYPYEQGEKHNQSALIIGKHHQVHLRYPNATLHTLPLPNEDSTTGALTLMRPLKDPFDEHTIETLNQAAQLLGPVLALRIQDQQSGWYLLTRSLKKSVTDVLGSERVLPKVITFSLIFLTLTLSLLKTQDRIHAKSVIEGAIQQAIVAPYNGYIESAEIRAGDQVNSGDILARLDTRDLLLEQEKLSGERNKISKEYQQALAARERVQVSIHSARIAQTDAQLSLVQENLKRSILRAPFSGIIAKGDLSQNIGVPVERGQLLFEIAPLGDYRVALSVDEHDVADLAIGQPGNLRLIGLPNANLPIKVSRITPLAASENGGNYFRVEGTIETGDIPLRPGMQGIAKIDVGEASILWVWTHSLFEQLQLWFWSLGL